MQRLYILLANSSLYRLPADRSGLLDCARENGASDKVIDAIRELPGRTYRDAAEVATAFHERVTGERRRPQTAPSKKSLQGTSAAALATLLEGIDLPASRSALLAHAQHSGADETLLKLIGAMPDGKYADAADVEKGFSRAKKKRRQTQP